MSASSQYLISNFCRTCLQQLPCESSYNLFAPPGLAKKLSVCTSLSVEQQDGFPDNICGVCYTRLNEMYDFQEQCVDAVQKFQDMVRLISSNEIKAPSRFGKSYNEHQDTNEIITSNDSEDINISSVNSMKIKECEQVLGRVEKIEIEETQIIQEYFNKIGVQPQNQETTHTGGKKYVCEICDKSFTRATTLKEHKTIHTGEKLHKCKICDKKFTYATHLRRHENIHSGKKPYGCKICGKIFSHRIYLSLHQMIHTGETPHKCEICDKKFANATQLKRHTYIHTGEKPYGCKICGEKFLHHVQLQRHKRTHAGESLCGKSYNEYQDTYEIITSNDSEESNITSVNSMKIKECEQVVLGRGKKIEKEETQIIQENFNKIGVQPQNQETTHTGGKKYECEICDKSFTRASILKEHKTIHTGEKPHKCKICAKKFTQAVNLKRHGYTHTGEKPYCCKNCGDKFSHPVQLQRHKRTHAGESLFECGTYGNGFRRKRMYACKTCGKDFPRREYLNLHERRQHSTKKPFKCEICLRGFIQSNELKRHKRTHTGESPFVCETCGKGFKKKQLLQIHQKKCINVTCNESEVSDKSKFKTEMEHVSPVSSNMDEQEFISISSK